MVWNRFHLGVPFIHHRSRWRSNPGHSALHRRLYTRRARRAGWQFKHRAVQLPHGNEQALMWLLVDARNQAP
jgi:hypothetical protein